MRKFWIGFILLFLFMPLSVFAQETSKTYCLSGVEYTGSLDGMPRPPNLISV